jgi:hypothetical protein
VLIRPDGVIAARLPANRAGVMVNTVDTRKEFYDASGPFRAAAMRGRLYTGRRVRDARSRDRRRL